MEEERKKPPNKNKTDNIGGRPRKEVNMKQLQSLLRIFCTKFECAAILGISEETIDNRIREETGEGYTAYRDRHNSHGKSSLRRAQFTSATSDRNPGMLIWMGKQFLEQKDVSRVESTGPDGGPIEVTKVERVIVDPAVNPED